MNASSRSGDTTVKLVVGLGNPGAEYASSRHNAGFMVIERLLASLPAGRFTESHSASSRFFSGRFRRSPLYLQQPLTYMNLSGEAVACAAGRLQLEPSEILIVSDDMDLPLGRLRLRRGGSDGGHNGLKSVIAELGSADFRRLRLGIGRPEHRGEVIDHVLSAFTPDEQRRFDAELDAAVKAVKLVLSVPFQLAMNEVNRREADPAQEAETNKQNQ
jgi:PTH1 family peptidyl-tRNA hydrolase